jgi:nucleotide-binding universal stress UspA family protein
MPHTPPRPLRILLPVDFSPENEVMYQMVQRLSQYLRLEVTLMHVAPKGSNAAKQAEYQRLLAAMSRQSDELDGGGPSWFSRCQCQAVVVPRRANLPRQIAEYAETQHADIILTSSKPHTGIGEYIVSSLLTRIIRYSQVPVLVLTPGTLPRLGRLLFATDFSHAAMTPLVQLAQIAPALRATLTCARINTARDFLSTRDFQELRRSVLRVLDDNAVDYLSHPIAFVTHNAYKLVDGILECADDELADVLVTATNARSGLSLFWNGSVTQELLARTDKPILIYKSQPLDEITASIDA